MHSEIVLPICLMKDQPQTVQISCNICAFIKHMHYPQCLFPYLCFYAEFIMQILGMSIAEFLPKDLIKNKQTDKVTTSKYIFKCI